MGTAEPRGLFKASPFHAAAILMLVGLDAFVRRTVVRDANP
jgi:hypothetical protein